MLNLFLYATLFSCRYVSSYGLSDPCDNIEDMLDHVARRLGALLKGIEPVALSSSQVLQEEKDFKSLLSYSKVVHMHYGGHVPDCS